jgi:hypothetical protein
MEKNQRKLALFWQQLPFQTHPMPSPICCATSGEQLNFIGDRIVCLVQNAKIGHSIWLLLLVAIGANLLGNCQFRIVTE